MHLFSRRHIQHTAAAFTLYWRWILVCDSSTTFASQCQPNSLARQNGSALHPLSITSPYCSQKHITIYRSHFLLGCMLGILRVTDCIKLCLYLMMGLITYQLLDMRYGVEDMFTPVGGCMWDLSEYAMGWIFVEIGAWLERHRFNTKCID